MTRILSEMVGSGEQSFRASLAKLEKVSGHPNADIKLTADVVQATKRKLKELGLDPHDTTGPELYAVLEQRLERDDAMLIAALKTSSDGDDIVASITHALNHVPLARSCFALKAMTAKKLLKKLPPKKAMKLLGYRSFDSMLKHEPVTAIFALAHLVESASWQKSLMEQYARLQAADFEVRDITVIHPSSQRWDKVAEEVVADRKQNVFGLKEHGVIVLFPVPGSEQPPAFTITTMLLALHSINEILAASTFLKLNQVRPDFGSIVQEVVAGEPQLTAERLDQPVAWHVIQRYYARFKRAFTADNFELHIQSSDLSWHSVERVLEHIEPRLGFWRGTAHLSLLHEHQPVSLNIMDVALASCNGLPFNNRIVHFARTALWQEILMRYLRHENIEQTIRAQLQPALATEMAIE